MRHHTNPTFFFFYKYHHSSSSTNNIYATPTIRNYTPTFRIKHPRSPITVFILPQCSPLDPQNSSTSTDILHLRHYSSTTSSILYQTPTFINNILNFAPTFSIKYYHTVLGLHYTVRYFNKDQTFSSNTGIFH